MGRYTNAITQTLGAIGAIAITTAAHYLWQRIRSLSPQAVLPIYCISFTVFISVGIFILRRIAQRSYQQYHRLTDFSLFLVCTVWGLFFAFPSLYAYNWAWSLPGEAAGFHLIQLLGGVLVVMGMVGVVASVIWLGISRSMGNEPDLLRTTGPCRWTRNPQAGAAALMILGYIILRPSWYAAGWMVLFVVLIHMMVGTEEEHLRRIFVDEYERYRTETPRYIRLP